jgi:hypothetical protein
MSGRKVRALPSYKNLPQGVQQMNLGDQKWQAELLFNFAVALISGVLLVFAGAGPALPQVPGAVRQHGDHCC